MYAINEPLGVSTQLPPCDKYEIDYTTFFNVYDQSCQSVLTSYWSGQSARHLHEFMTLIESNDYIFIAEMYQSDQEFGNLLVLTLCDYEFTNYYDEISLKVTFMKDSLVKDKMQNILERLHMSNSNNQIIKRNDMNKQFEKYFITHLVQPSIEMPLISDIFYNAPYTTVKWFDNTTTTVRASNEDEFNKEFGLAMALAKKYYECLGTPHPRASFKQAVYIDATDQTEKTKERREYKQNKKLKHSVKRNRNGNFSNGKKSSKR